VRQRERTLPRDGILGQPLPSFLRLSGEEAILTDLHTRSCKQVVSKRQFEIDLNMKIEQFPLPHLPHFSVTKLLFATLRLTNLAL